MEEGVARLASDSAAIIVCIDETEGIWWELELLRDRGYISKSLVLFHPKFHALPHNAAIFAKVIAHLHLDRETSPDQQRCIIGFTQDRDGAPQVSYASSFSRFSYLLAIRSFLRKTFEAAR